jgi:hypothetical protein
MKQRIPNSIDEFINEAKKSEDNNIGKKVSFRGADVATVKDSGKIAELISKYKSKFPKFEEEHCNKMNGEDFGYAVRHDDGKITLHLEKDIKSKLMNTFNESKENDELNNLNSFVIALDTKDGRESETGKKIWAIADKYDKGNEMAWDEIVNALDTKDRKEMVKLMIAYDKK